MSHHFSSFGAGVAHQIGRYADAVRIPAGLDQVVVSGTPGLRVDGSVPEDFVEEVRQAWRNVDAILAAAGATLEDVVSIRQWLVDSDDIAAYVSVRGEFISHESASMLAVTPALVRPSFKVEIEVVAAVAAT